MSFEDMGLDQGLLRAIADIDYTTPTPIQVQAIPKALEGHDLMCCAQTGTGKTAAFALPILHALAQEERKHLSAVVLVPTRELAIQVGQNVVDYSRHLDLVLATAFGGVPIEPQEMMLRAHVDVLVATPGRLIDHMWRGNVDYRHTRFLVLDEADRMLDMGFIKDVLEIVNEIPKARQSMLFSATLDRDIERLSRDILVEPVRIEVAPPASTLDTVDQYLVRTSAMDKRTTLERLIRQHRMKKTIIFAKTKTGASNLANHLARRGFRAVAFHSDRTQSERVRTLESFKEGACDLLVATDIAARGLDVDEVSHVVNYDMPYSPDSYVHRIGRTARAGRSGMAITLVTSDDLRGVKAIERLIARRLPYLGEERPNGAGEEPRRPVASRPAAARPVPSEVGGGGGNKRRRRRSRRGRRGGEPGGNERAAERPARESGSGPRDRSPRAGEGERGDRPARERSRRRREGPSSPAADTRAAREAPATRVADSPDEGGVLATVRRRLSRLFTKGK